jgi:hypothetical protein
VHEVDLTKDLLKRQIASLRALRLLSQRIDNERWCVVGGMMVLIAARQAGRMLPRAEQTKDADVLLDVCVNPGSLSAASSVLTSLGYEPLPGWDDPKIARCTFASGEATIDLLAPDDADPAQLVTDTGVSSIAIPGGRRALDGAEPVRITYDLDERDVEVRVPLLPTALAVKGAAALDPRTAGQPRHIADVAAMLTIIENPRQTREAMPEPDIALLTRLRDRLLDDGDVAWRDIGGDDRQAGQAAARIITG